MTSVKDKFSNIFLQNCGKWTALVPRLDNLSACTGRLHSVVWGNHSDRGLGIFSANVWIQEDDWNQTHGINVCIILTNPPK